MLKPLVGVVVVGAVVVGSGGAGVAARVEGRYQDTVYSCVPAASAMSLGALGVRVSQGRLAAEMGTTRGGTSGARTNAVLNRYARAKGYAYGWADVSSAAKMRDAVAHDVGGLKAAPVLGVWMEKLPWNRGKVRRSRVGHAVVVYGYDRAEKTVTVWDPWRPTGGRHTLTAAALAAAAQANGLHYVTALRDAGGLADVGGGLAGVDRADGKLYRYAGPGYRIGGRRVLDGRDWNRFTRITGDGRTGVLAVDRSGALHLFRRTADGLDDGRVVDRRNWNTVTGLTAVGAHRTLLAVGESTGTLYRFAWTRAGRLGPAKKAGARNWNTVRELTAIGDLDGDGLAGDLVGIGRTTGYLYLFRQTPSGYARGQKLGEDWTGDRSLVGLGDVDTDGHPDLGMVRNTDGAMFVYGGTRGTFTPPRNTGTGWNG